MRAQNGAIDGDADRGGDGLAEDAATGLENAGAGAEELGDVE